MTRTTTDKILAAMARAFAVGALAVLLGACVDTTAGETAHYGEPCSGSFFDVLICAGETGGMDPGDVERPPVDYEIKFSCADACRQYSECGFFEAEEIEACTEDCESDTRITRAVLDCIRDNGCANASTCLGGS